ncbi:MAG: ubiquinone biosynthesis hydroxylase [Hoeflea sp.]|uniref:ubiquinone biosynthesis hydroxylase n=1 Tax=Hoeflea sp. TaxID=1940281 RepID=UPI001DEE6C86|nr:ubiquinone biosynthesis hydroxylase [Hoeflea sp.]MBU4531830.1 ubiquinone biosynthesis hydroxylase [Alphaproteobacteria bacterium]MBU4544686.1 ubiquinone biosynthesis hydroxylase [Alphaproteobacteria bacterium]MBU4552917.1 ubiquinone biosynthesis hydroxylase [Alphaproteobacteria bacterium]MBV1725106.1 ubiquinone biosynthesis hydroxylase [Hoeflea sp.]MBV1761126.1 ubiquinone biosynthesis hydroxylase [Hoeflea sp.]
MKIDKLDILVCGGGYVGLSAALAIKAAAPSLDVAVIDAAPADVWRKDQRASAIAAGAKRLLTTLDIWATIEPEAQAISEMVVTDSRTSDPVRPVFLTFGGEIEDGGPFAHMVPNVALVEALRTKAAELNLPIHQSAVATGLTVSETEARVETADGRVFAAKLVVAADGVKSHLRDMAGIKTQHWDYGQSGIVTTVAHERPHHGRAEEHFMPSGPFAILPLTGNRSSLVWTERTETANKLLAEDDFVFEAELERRFGHHLGALRIDGGRKAFPLGLTLARDFVKPRVALAGDAAHGIHPVAGQGLNLGFRDVAALAETIVDAHRLGLDIGSISVLERYQIWRRFDTVRMGLTSDILTRMFSNDFTPLRMVRDFGLGLVDRMPAMKRYFINQAAGIPDASGPRLLRGEAI